ncbi:hypothetical protein ABIB73_002441 [Bradyrhizobium sp. F1.4.3]
MRHNLDRGIMRQLVQGRSMPIDRFEIGLRWGHLHIIFRRHIKGAIATYAEVDSGRLDQSIDRRLNHAGWRWWRSGYDVRSQPVALIEIENGEALQKWNSLCLLAGLVYAALFVDRHKAVGVNDGRAALTLADVATQR